MARSTKQKSKGFGKFLDFIGLVDSDQEEEFDPEFDQPRSSNRGRSGRKAPVEDEFAEEPRMARASTRRERPSSGKQSSYSGNRYESEDEWQSGARPDYAAGGRTQQRASSNRASGRYASEQRYGAPSQNRSASRYSSNPPVEEEYRGGYNNASSASYASSTRWNSGWGENEMGYRADSYQNGYAGQGAGSPQRPQNIIVRLQSIEDCKGVILSLIEKKTILLNLDDLDSVQTQRALDTMSGASFAIGAKLSRASDKAWLLTPSNMEVVDQNDEGAGFSGGRRR